ncbi:hypothetical protein H4R23_002114 [Coemansia sp. Cherry 401B]|nr:hypothetical protein H4R23_002114 [Coemansia sp. Cherry 401B]
MWAADDSFDEQTYGGIRQLEQTSFSSARDHIPAASANPYAALHHINRELMELGLPSPLMLPELAECLEDNLRVVECLAALLQQRRKDLRFRDDCDDALRKAMGEEDLLRSTIQRLERELDQAQRDAAGTRIKWDDAERRLAESEARARQLSVELRTTRSNAAMARAQFLHDSKKREQESVRLKDRLQKLIVDKLKAAKVGMELANPVTRDRSGRPVESVARDRRLLEELIGRYEATEVELVAKVDRLQALLRKLAAALARLHGDVVPGAVSANAAAADEAADIDEIDASLEQLDSIRTCVQLERSQQPAPAAVDPRELEQRDQQIASLQAEVAQLEREIAELKATLGEQKQVLELATRRGLAENPLEASFSEMSLEQLDAEREAVRRERQQLEEERRRFTDAAIELGNERSDLKRERDEFERTRAGQGTVDLMGGLPPTPQWMKGIDTTQATPMILNQLQDLYKGTPTNALLASMAAGAAYSAALAAATPTAPGAADPASHDPASRDPASSEPISDELVSRTMEDEFPEIASPSTGHPRQPLTSTRTAVRASRAPAETPPTARAQSQRTPAEVRSGRQARVCTRPGCAAHAPHSHDDGSPAVMELKPPVPRFRRRPEDSSARSAQRPQQQSRNGQAARASAADIYR